MNINRLLYKEVEFIGEINDKSYTRKYYRFFNFHFKVRDIFKVLGFSDKQVTVKFHTLSYYPTGMFSDYYTERVYNDSSSEILFKILTKNLVVGHYYLDRKVC